MFHENLRHDFLLRRILIPWQLPVEQFSEKAEIEYSTFHFMQKRRKKIPR